MDNQPEKAATGAATGERRTVVAKVLSHKMRKTVVVAIERKYAHPIYRKVVRKVTKLKAHDENDDCRVGDVVRIAETRPLSKDKHWRVIEVLERAKAAEPVPA